MKRNIAVKEKELIDKLNKHLSDHVDPEVHVDTAEGDDKTVVSVIDKENDKVVASWHDGDRNLMPKVPNGEIDIDLDPTKNMTDEEKERFNMFGPCSLKEVGGDYQDEEESDWKNLTDAQKAERYNKFMKELKKACGKREYTQVRPQDIMDTEYEYVNHPKHYNNYDVEVIDMMERVFGTYETYAFCKLNAFKYRMRAGTKPNIDVKQDLDKEQWYLNKAKELKDKMKRYKKLEDNALL
jgi:hypothetical protein